MNVCHIVPAPFGGGGVVGGAERYALELARHMASRVSTTLVTFGEEPREEQVGPLRVEILGNAWHAGEAAEKLIAARRIAAPIMVGIYNTGFNRMNEYAPSRVNCVTATRPLTSA